MKINGHCIQDWVKWEVAVVEKARTFSVVARDEEEAEDFKAMMLLFESFFFSLSGEYVMNLEIQFHCNVWFHPITVRKEI
jgi:hypothetical protein